MKWRNERGQTSPKITRTVRVRLADGRITDSKLTSFTIDRSLSNPGSTILQLEIEEIGSFSAEADNYFDTLMDLRRELEPLQVKILCFGARTDVWASGMQRDMGSGPVAYLLSGSRAGRLPEQSIFDNAPPETVGTVDEQEKYVESWRQSKLSKRS